MTSNIAHDSLLSMVSNYIVFIYFTNVFDVNEKYTISPTDNTSNESQ